MEYFHSESGHRPYFSYRIQVPGLTEEMYQWCKEYDAEGKYFRRWHVEWGSVHQRNYDIVQFEWEQAAIDFSLRWA